MDDKVRSFLLVAKACKAIYEIEGDSPYYRKTRELLYGMCWSSSIGYMSINFKAKENIHG